MEDLYDITYMRKRAFIVHMDNRDLVFKCKEKLYITDWGTMCTVATTVRKHEQLFTKELVHRAKLAHEFVKNNGYPSIGEAVHLLSDGNVCNLPTMLSADIERTYRIYGTQPEYLRGQMVRKTVSRKPLDLTLRYVDKNPKL